MSVFSRARYALARLLHKAGGLAIVPRWVDTTVLEPSWRALSRDGYSRNAAVFACVSTLAFDIPEPPLYCYTPSGEMLNQSKCELRQRLDGSRPKKCQANRRAGQ